MVNIRFYNMKTKSYKQQQLLETLENCTISKVSKGGKFFLMHEFQALNESDQYTFKVRKKLHCSHVVQLLDEFEENNNKYYISEYIEMDLLKLAINHSSKHLQLKQVLDYIAQIIEILDEMHSQKLVYKNVRPQKIRIKNNEPYFYDFSLSQFRKRRQRMFDVVGSAPYLAPEYFSDDGYGEEVDIWAVGVLLYYLLFHNYPFKFKGQEENCYRDEFNLKCGQGFKFSKEIENTNFNATHLKGNKYLQDFFKRIFHLNPMKRIDVQGIKKHPLFEEQFSNLINKSLLSVIEESGQQQSLFLSKMNNFPCSKILHKEEIILDFIEQTAQLFLLECPQIYSQQLRYRTQFAILKVGLCKATMLLDVLFGIREPFFKVDQKQWKQVRSSSALNLIKDKLERKKKILHMMFKSAFMNVKPSIQKQPNFFNQKIPENFDDIKLLYRGVLLQMFETGRKNLPKAKGNRRLSRKLTQSMVRVIILFLVNRLFESQQQIKLDFQHYLIWSKKKDLQDLQDWIQTDELSNLKLFMKAVTTKYL